MRGGGLASFPGPLREFRTASDERAGPGNEASGGYEGWRVCGMELEGAKVEEWRV